MKDFELLVSPGVFNDSLMNDAVCKFKRYEDASLSYTGINRRQGEKVGGYDTVVSNEDYSNMFSLQQASMEAPEPTAVNLPDAVAAPVIHPKPVPTKPATQPAPLLHHRKSKSTPAASRSVLSCGIRRLALEK